ncbi:MAG: hypothetical protein HZC10_03750 [Nitrospirae bacterium]|nr:hypothetical protein [Nitrospirota bacterium]
MKELITEERLPFEVGDTWSAPMNGEVYIYKILAIGDIIVSDRRYRCFKIKEIMEDGRENCYWYAPDTGIVKWKIGKIKGVR